MILVTGGAGFIGSNLVRALNARGRDDVIVVDDLEQGDKFKNLVGLRIADYVDRAELEARLAERESDFRHIEAVLHQGACTDTTVRDGRAMMRDNYDASKALFGFARRRGVPLIYASSAAVYGGGDRFVEEPACEAPLNVYGYSKLLFDEHVRRAMPTTSSQVVGLRYFNVYGPGEAHKGGMASVALHLDRQARETGELRLFGACGDWTAGEQRRDFVHVDDVVAVNLWFFDNTGISGIFNVGTGRARTFNDLARAVSRFHRRGEITYVPFPEALRGSYQSYTQADLSRLRAAGYDAPFRELEDGVASYLAALERSRGAAP